jgi:hypothetical protein
MAQFTAPLERPKRHHIVDDHRKQTRIIPRRRQAPGPYGADDRTVDRRKRRRSGQNLVLVDGIAGQPVAVAKALTDDEADVVGVGSRRLRGERIGPGLGAVAPWR